MADSTLSEIFDFGRGIFKDIVDLERAEIDFALIKQARADEAAIAQRQAPVASSGVLSASSQSLLIWGGLLLAAVLIVPRLIR